MKFITSIGSFHLLCYDFFNISFSHGILLNFDCLFSSSDLLLNLWSRTLCKKTGTEKQQQKWEWEALCLFMWMWRYQKNETTQKSGKNPRSPLFSSSPWSKMTCHYYFSSFLFLMVVVFRCHLAASSSVPFPYNHCCVRYTLNKQQRQQPLIPGSSSWYSLR